MSPAFKVVTNPLFEQREAFDLLAQHDLYFQTREATTPQMVQAAQALRYQVYCIERKFEDAAEHPDHLERDEFDASSIHGLLYHQPSEAVIGTVRIILPTLGAGDSFPILRLLRENDIELEQYIPIQKSIEVSRFAISKGFRNRQADDAKELWSRKTPSRSNRETSGSLPCLSLIQFLVRESRAMGVTHWAAVMEVKLLRLLASMGINFTPLGPLVFYHGLRQPCYCHLPEMLEKLLQQRPDYWRVVAAEP